MLPSTLEYIGEKAFHECPNLATLVCAAVVPPTYVVGEDGNDSFMGQYGHPHVLYVPQGSEEAYRNAPVWKNIPEIVGVSDEILKEMLDGVVAVKAAVSDVTVSASNGEIAVSGGIGGMCEIYTADGRSAATVRLTGDTRVALPQGLYIVKAAGKVCKVRI